MQIIICDEHLMFSEALSSLMAQRGHRVLARSRTLTTPLRSPTVTKRTSG